ncbi:hypothetical protein ES703_35810 [subsurface metagenome]|nr:hypothetical protein [bacterium]
MSRTTKALLIAAVAVMLVAATSAYSYYETWDGWFNSGNLYYNSKTYSYVEGGIGVDDSTTRIGMDLFYRTTIPRIAFVCAAGYRDSIFVYIDEFGGAKEYGQSGTTEGIGSWSGIGYADRAGSTMLFYFGGSWEAEFDYTDPPDGTYEGTWRETQSSIPGVRGSGTSSGSLQ